MTKIAISTGVYLRERETQINSHIRNLFGGQTVVLAEKTEAKPPIDRDYLIWGDSQGGVFDRVRSVGLALLFYDANRTMRVPYGGRRHAIVSFLRGNKVDAILSEFGTDALRMSPIAEEMGLPIFTYFRGYDASAYLSQRTHMDAYRLMMPRLRGVFSVSQYLLDRLALCGISHDKSFVVPSGVDTLAFQPKKKLPGSCLAVGRFIEKKRPDLTIRAFARAARDIPNARLEMIGDGPLLEDCRRIALDIDISQRVIFHGPRSHAFVRDRLSETEVFLQHSVTARNGDTEGFPTSIQEAMSSGAVVISTRHAGISEAIHEGESGFLVDEGDIDAFAAHIRNSLCGNYNLQEIGQNARSVAVRDFDRSFLLKKVENVIASLI